MTSPPPDGALPEAAERRMAGGSFSSGLSVPDFAASLHLGLEPVAFVQGFCVMQWSWYGTYGNRFSAVGSLGLQAGPGGANWPGGGWKESWRCPHGYGMLSAEHRAYGLNYQETWVEEAWTRGITGAIDRMVGEATSAGAHGIVGVVDSTTPLADMGVLEFHVQGTAVRVAGADPPGRAPWSTYLAGERLAKMIEAGYAPVTVALSFSSVRVFANCVTQYLVHGPPGMYRAGTSRTAEIEQMSHAQMAARDLARRSVRAALGRDSLHAASLTATTNDFGEGDAQVQCLLRGNRVRRFKAFDPVPPPVPTVRLG